MQALAKGEISDAAWIVL